MVYFLDDIGVVDVPHFSSLDFWDSVFPHPKQKRGNKVCLDLGGKKLGTDITIDLDELSFTLFMKLMWLGPPIFPSSELPKTAVDWRISRLTG